MDVSLFWYLGNGWTDCLKFGMRLADMGATENIFDSNQLNSESSDSTQLMTNNGFTGIDSNQVMTQNGLLKIDSNQLTTQKASRIF